MSVDESEVNNSEDKNDEDSKVMNVPLYMHHLYGAAVFEVDVDQSIGFYQRLHCLAFWTWSRRYNI